MPAIAPTNNFVRPYVPPCLCPWLCASVRSLSGVNWSLGMAYTTANCHWRCCFASLCQWRQLVLGYGLHYRCLPLTPLFHKHRQTHTGHMMMVYLCGTSKQPPELLRSRHRSLHTWCGFFSSQMPTVRAGRPSINTRTLSKNFLLQSAVK